MLTKYKNMITTSIRTSMGTVDGFRPLGLDPPENWEEDNHEQLRIISPMSYTEETNGFKIISPTSDISNPSDVWRMHQPAVVVVHHDRNGYYQNHNNSRNELTDKENMGGSDLGKNKSKAHHRMDSITKVFGCFDENVKMNTIKKQEEEERQSQQRQLVEI